MPQAADPENPDKTRLRHVGRKVRERLAANKAVRRIPTAQAELWALAGFLDPIECGRLIALIGATARPSQAYDVASGFRTSHSGDVDPRDPFTCAR